MRIKLHLAVLTSSILSIGAATADTVSSGYILKNRASLTVGVPSGRARVVSVELSDVVDTNGDVAVFRLDAFKGRKNVGTQRITFREPGGIETAAFSKTFDRVRIADSEGTIVARVRKFGFCPDSITNAESCFDDVGPAPEDHASGSPTQGGVTSPSTPTNGGGQETGGGQESDGQSGSSNSGGSPWGGFGGSDGAGNNDGGQEQDNGNTDDNGGGQPTPPNDNGNTQNGNGDEPDDVGTPANNNTPDEDAPAFGEHTPITPMSGVTVQAGIASFESYIPYTPWLNQAKLIKRWRYMVGAQTLIDEPDTVENKYGVAQFPTNGHPDGRMEARMIWNSVDGMGLDDIAGKWRLSGDGTTPLSPWLKNITVTKRTDDVIEFVCQPGDKCRVRIDITSSQPDSRPPSLVQLTDSKGRAVSDAEGLKNGLVTRERWRRALYGYGEVRLMHGSGAVSTSGAPIRFDQFPDMEYYSWLNSGFYDLIKAPNEEQKAASQTDLVTKTFAPVEARLRAAWEVGAIYHHNFPPMFTEHKGDIDFDVLGDWAVKLWADESISEEQKLSIFNDYELQHIDEFGAEIMKNRHLLVKNQIKLEVGNETWNWGRHYAPGTVYMQRKAKAVAQKMGRSTEFAGVTPQAVQTGYELTKAIARLRKMYPAIEWRGVMAVHTNDSTSYRDPRDPAPTTPSGEHNRTLYGLVKGYELFWQDYEANSAEWSKLYTTKPARPGDWFEAHGTTYFKLHAKLRDKKTHLAGIPPTELLERVAQKSEWPALRQDILAFFMNDDEDRGHFESDGGQRSRLVSAHHIKAVFLSLTETADLYGMQVGSYEGGNHAGVGDYYKKMSSNYPALAAFWADFQNSVEMGLIQAAVHDAAVDAGWKTLSDFTLFQTPDAETMFGSRRSMADITPRYCEYARWMPSNPPRPVGLENASDLLTPHQRCGKMIDYLNQAKNNDYYVGKDIPEAESLIP